MKTIKVASATNTQLNWLVAKLEGEKFRRHVEYFGDKSSSLPPHEFSTNWSQGGPIIERKRIAIQSPNDKGWYATDYMLKIYESGSTPLIAAMRCHIVGQLGNIVEVPEELT